MSFPVVKYVYITKDILLIKLFKDHLACFNGVRQAENGGWDMWNCSDQMKRIERATQITTEDVDVDQLIIDNTARKKVDETVEVLFAKMKGSIQQEVESIFAPRFEFENVSESGIIICGKEGNIATSKSAFFEIFHAYKKVCTAEQFEEATYLAGRKAALHFSDDFRKVLCINNKVKLPNTEEKFMNLYSKFDHRSAWWEKPVEYLDKEAEDKPYISAAFKKPFTTYPWIDGDNETNNLFLIGYIQTLFNCSSDILRVIGESKKMSMQDRKMALKVVAEDQLDQEKEQLQIYYTNQYVRTWLEIDRIIYCAVNMVLGASSGENIRECVEALKELKEQLSSALGRDIAEETDYNRVSKLVRQTVRDIEANKFRLHVLLNEFRILYEDYRIQQLDR